MQSAPTTYRYRWEFYKKKKERCPYCNSAGRGPRRTFTRYIDNETGELISEKYGYCDRSEKCGYNNSPYKDKEFLRSHGTKSEAGETYFGRMAYRVPNVYFDSATYEKATSETAYAENNFLVNLFRIATEAYQQKRYDYKRAPTWEMLCEIAHAYKIGTIRKGEFAGATCFPFITHFGNITAVQVKKFDAHNHTIKPYGTNFLHKILAKKYEETNAPKPTWLHNYLQQPDFLRALFGEHLLKNKPDIVCLFEAPKTAMYYALYLRMMLGEDFTFNQISKTILPVACYAKDTFSWKLCKAFRGVKVHVIPDLSKGGKTFAQWKSRAEQLAKMDTSVEYIMYDGLEKIAQDWEREADLDYADFLF